LKIFKIGNNIKCKNSFKEGQFNSVI
jgi:hypothetical protein